MVTNNLKNKIEKAKVLVFDLDGTIINLQCKWDKLKEELFTFCLSEYKLKIDFSSLNKGLAEVILRLSKKGQKGIYSIMERYELEGVNRAKPILPIIDFVKKYPRKEKSIFSTNTRKAIIAALKKFKIESYFNLIVGKEDVNNQKPHPEGLYLIINYFKVSPLEIVFIGNQKADLEAGRNAGIQVCYAQKLLSGDIYGE